MLLAALTERARRSLPTIGTRYNVAGCLALTVYIGFCYLLQDPSRYRGPGFKVAVEIMSMHWWGVTFLACALALTGMVVWSGKAAEIGLLLMAGFYTMWMVIFFLAVQHPPQGSLSVCGLFFFIAWSHFSSAQSVARRHHRPCPPPP